MWRQYEKDVKTLPAATRLPDKQAAPSLPAIANIAYHDNTKMRDLASRVKLSEQSNRVLLEELMKLQQDLKVALRQNEDMVLKEQKERLAMKDKVEAAENMYAKVSMQLMRTEEKVNMEHSTLVSLLSQSKEVERAVSGSEQRSLLKGEQIDRYLSRFRDEISELRQTSEQINSNMRLVGEDLKTFKHRFEMQNSEFSSATQELKQKVKRIESDTIAAMDSIVRKQENRQSLDSNTSHLKQNVDLKLSELRDAINEMRRKSDVEASERRAIDQQAQLNVEKVQVSLRELESKYQEVIHTSNLNKRDKEINFESEKNILTYKMAELSEDQNKKALQREMLLREDAQMKFVVLEKKLQEEQASRLAFEQSVRCEMEDVLESLKIHLSEEFQSMKQNAKLTQVHGDQSLVKISECVTLLEGEIEAGKKAFEEVLHAEIIARQTQNEKTVTQCEELHEKLSIAVATLQQAIAGITTQTQDAVEKIKRDMILVLDQSGDSGFSGLADIDSRLTNLNKHIIEVEETLESRLNENSSSAAPAAANNDYERLNKKIERTNKWQEVAEKTLKELHIKIQPLNGEITIIKDAIEDIRTEMETQRIDNLSDLNMDENPTDPIPVDGNVEKKVKKIHDDVVQMSRQLEKLDHTVNTLRTVLSQKIASEAKTVEVLREVFSADIEKVVNYFLKEQRRVFIKYHEMDAKVYRADVEKDGAKEAHNLHLALLSINRWGVYGAYKMLKLKAAWFKVAEKKNKTPDASDNYVNYDNGDEKNEEEDKSEKEEDKSEEESEKESEKEESDEESEKEESDEEKSDEDESDEEESDKESDDEESDDEKPVTKPDKKPTNGKTKGPSPASNKGSSPSNKGSSPSNKGSSLGSSGASPSDKKTSKSKGK